MNEFLVQSKQIWARLTGVQRGLVFGTAALVIIGAVIAIVAGSSTEWRVLDTGLDRKSAQSVIAKLEDSDIPYRLRESGSAIEIPSDRWQDVQSIVIKGDLLNGATGRGFDKGLEGGLMDTKSQREFKQRIAQQEELEMTIVGLDGIEDATVYITPAKRHYTKEGSERAKASVMLRPSSGHLINSSQVESIVRMLSGAVKELDPDGVVVTDTHGQVLARLGGDGAGIGTIGTAAHTRGLSLQAAAEEALHEIFGRDKVVVRCHVELEMEAVTKETEGLIPGAKAVLSETIRTTENTKPFPGGAASTVPTTAGKNATNSAIGSKTEDTQTEYAVGKTHEKRIKAAGAVKHLAVSVVADASLTPHMAAIEKLVKGAVGYQEVRGDFWGGVRFAPFVKPEVIAEPAAPDLWTMDFIWKVATWSITGIVGLVMVVMLWMSARRAQRDVQSALAGIAEDNEEPQTEERVDPKDELRDLVDEDVDTVSKLLRNWLYEPVGSR